MYGVFKKNQQALWKLFNIAFLFCRLSGIKDLVRGKQLVSVILKLMGYCVKLKVLVCLELFALIFFYFFTSFSLFFELLTKRVYYFSAGQQAIPVSSDSEHTQCPSWNSKPGTFVM